MRAFVTGGTGFLDGELVRGLRARGDDVVALVRSRSRAGRLEELDCGIVEGDLQEPESIGRGMEGCDAAFHVAAMYEVGVPRSWRSRMFDANVGGAEHVLDAAIDGVLVELVQEG